MSTQPDEDRYEVIAIQYGTREAPASDVYLHFAIYGEPDREIGMSYYFWLIRNSQRTILVDCGFSSEGGAKRNRTTLCSLREAMTKLGVAIEDIDLLVITHGHYDHIGNLVDLPDLPAVMPRTDYEFWTSPMALRPLFLHSAEESDIAELRRRGEAGQIELVDGAGTIAPGIEMIEVGGHSPGQAILLIDLGDHRLVLASDAIHYYEELDRDWPFTYIADLSKAYAAIDTLRELAADGATTLVPGHDPEVMSRFPRVDGELSKLAVIVS